jgi:hypothetical protein
MSCELRVACCELGIWAGNPQHATRKSQLATHDTRQLISTVVRNRGLFRAFVACSNAKA